MTLKNITFKNIYIGKLKKNTISPLVFKTLLRESFSLKLYWFNFWYICADRNLEAKL